MGGWVVGGGWRWGWCVCMNQRPARRETSPGVVRLLNERTGAGVSARVGEGIGGRGGSGVCADGVRLHVQGVAQLG